MPFYAYLLIFLAAQHLFHIVMDSFRQVLQYVTELLNRNVGFLINERFINIPAQVRIERSFILTNFKSSDHCAPLGDPCDRDEEGQRSQPSL